MNRILSDKCLKSKHFKFMTGVTVCRPMWPHHSGVVIEGGKDYLVAYFSGGTRHGGGHHEINGEDLKELILHPDDPATNGCLLSMVRKRFGGQVCTQFAPALDLWELYMYTDGEHFIEGTSEFEVLVRALIR